MEFSEKPFLKRSRNRLTSDQAVAIYNQRPTHDPEIFNPPRYRGLSVLFAHRYGVSPKTIRDIWNHRTWNLETKQLSSQYAMDALHIRVSSNEVPCFSSTICNSSLTREFFQLDPTNYHSKKQGRPRGSKDKRPRTKHNKKIAIGPVSIRASDVGSPGQVGCGQTAANRPWPYVSCNGLEPPMPTPILCRSDVVASLDDALFAIFEDLSDSPNQYQSSMAAAADPFSNDWSLW
jgi:hypothetical protein